MVPRMLLRCLISVCVILSVFPVWVGANPTPASPHPTVPEDVLPLVSPQAVALSLRPLARQIALPETRWGKDNGRDRWTLAALAALRSHANVLPEIVPRDIAQWCPGYPQADRAGREAFWVGLVSTLVKHESTYRPTAVGGGGKWYGLMQILPATARGYKCRARSGAALKNPIDNLSCGFRIMAVTVPRDMVVSHRMRGVAADWGPFHSRRKREDMMRWTRSQPYCQGLTRSLRPISRPAHLTGLRAPAEPRPSARPAVSPSLTPAVDARLAMPVSSGMSDG